MSSASEISNGEHYQRKNIRQQNVKGKTFVSIQPEMKSRGHRDKAIQPEMKSRGHRDKATKWHFKLTGVRFVSSLASSSSCCSAAGGTIRARSSRMQCTVGGKSQFRRFVISAAPALSATGSFFRVQASNVSHV
jgi:hypothetical protein